MISNSGKNGAVNWFCFIGLVFQTPLVLHLKMSQMHTTQNMKCTQHSLKQKAKVVVPWGLECPNFSLLSSFHHGAVPEAYEQQQSQTTTPVMWAGSCTVTQYNRPHTILEGRCLNFNNTDLVRLTPVCHAAGCGVATKARVPKVANPSLQYRYICSS